MTKNEKTDRLIGKIKDIEQALSMQSAHMTDTRTELAEIRTELKAMQRNRKTTKEE